MNCPRQGYRLSWFCYAFKVVPERIMTIKVIHISHVCYTSLQSILSSVWMGDSGVTWQTLLCLGDLGQCQDLNHVHVIWYNENGSSVIFLPQTHNPSVIIRKIQTNSNREASCSTPEYHLLITTITC